MRGGVNRRRRVMCSWAVLLSAAAALLFTPAHATHQKAAELIIEHVSGYIYKAKLYTYTFTESPADRPELEIGWGDGSFSVLERAYQINIGNSTKINYYESTHEYAGPGTYVLFMEDPNRNSGVVNIPNSVLISMYISSTLVISPWLGNGNNGPVTTVRPVADNACVGQPYIHNPGAYDPDGDLLTYRVIPCRGEGGEEIPGYTYPAASDSFYMDYYGGNLVWKSPMVQGEYNVAILIEEWRNHNKIGDLTRDMQIIVKVCNNAAPELTAPEHLCVTAGDTLFFPITATDEDSNRITVSFSGELSTLESDRIKLTRLGGRADSVVYGFYWYTKPEDSRLNEYQLFVRAEDDGEPNLSATATVSIKVNAPAVRFTQTETYRKMTELHWSRTESPHAASYTLYRRSFQDAEFPADSCTTGLVDSTYMVIAPEIGVRDTIYRDNSVREGYRYCYRVHTNFADGDQSFLSEPVCMELPNIAPLITKVSVENTSSTQGVNLVCWRAPIEPDSEKIDNWVYRLFAGTNALDLELVAELPYDTLVCYYDSSRNTAQKQHLYRVDLDSFPSVPASSVYLKATAQAGRIYLEWNLDQPWQQKRYSVYRSLAAGDEPSFERIASLSERQTNYVDAGIPPETPYLYYVEAEGSYESETAPWVLTGKSNIVQQEALLPEPCQPYLFLVSSTCTPLRNILTWDFDSSYRTGSSLSGMGKDGSGNAMDGSANAKDASDADDCEISAAYYEIYRKYTEREEFLWLAATEEKRYEDNDPGSLFCLYQVKTVSPAGFESAVSNTLAVDNWHCFQFELPNVFTPNNDGINDVWRAKEPRFTEEFEITVVNRWGVEVYRSRDPYFEWDGTVRGKGTNHCPDGPYFYYAEFKARVNGQVRSRSQSGSVSILR